MNVIDWIIDEMASRISSGKSGGEAAGEVLALVFEFGRDEELLKAKGQVIVHAIWADSARAARLGPQPKLAAAEANYYQAPHTVIQAPARAQSAKPAPALHGVAALRQSIFFAPISVAGRWIPMGEMRRDDWETKVREYEKYAKRDMERAASCTTIAERVTNGRTTRECLTEDEFENLLPDNGL